MAAPAPIPFKSRDKNSMDEPTVAETNYQQPRQRDKSWYDYQRLLYQVLDGNELKLFNVLLDMAGENNQGWCWPTMDELIWRTGGMTRPIIEHSIKCLEIFGLLEVNRKPRGSHLPNRYRPSNEPSDHVIEQLNKQLAWDLSCKKSLHEASQKENLRARVKNLSASCKENLRARVKNLYSNGSHVTDLKERITEDTNVSSGAEPAPSADEPPETEKVIITDMPLVAQLEQEYLEADRGNGPEGHASRDRMTVVGKAFQLTFCRSPDYGRLVAMAGPRQLNSGWALIELILSLTGKKVHDDPHDYLQQAVNQKLGVKGKTNGQGRSGKPALAGNGAATPKAKQPAHPQPRQPASGVWDNSKQAADERARKFAEYRLPGS
jgi:hypothetical protein